MNIELTFLETPLVSLSVRHFHVSEGLSFPFEAAIAAVSPDHDVDFEKLIGRPARVRIDRGSLGARTWTGVVAAIELGTDTGGAEGLASYEVRVVAALWLLTQKRSRRVFQHATTIDIARAILAPRGIEFDTRIAGRAPPKHEMRIQHGETDFAFLSRLFCEAGLSYFFEETETPDGNSSRLIITDEPTRAEPRPGAVIPVVSNPSPSSANAYIAEANWSVEVRPGAVTLTDYDLRRPRYAASYRAVAGNAELEHTLHAPGVAIIDEPAVSGERTDTPASDAVSRARSDEGEGQAIARRAIEALRSERKSLRFSTNIGDLTAGAILRVAFAEQANDAETLLITRVTFEGDAIGEWSTSAEAVATNEPWRPQTTHARPRIHGVESATVTGPAGEEIHCDEFGRVRVRFHWDRGALGDPLRSAWVRVSASWAGAGFGMIALPRVGDEVLISHDEGDPDQPIIVGRVHDATNIVPEPLPSAKAKSTWRTRSTPTSSGYSELSFDDRKGYELVHLRAQRDLEKRVQRSEIENVGKHRSASVARHHASVIAHDDIATAGHMHSVAIAKISASGAASPLGTRREIIAKRITITAGGATITLDGADIVVSADHEVRINAGKTVSIQGKPYVHLNPPLALKGGDVVARPAASDHLVWFTLLSEGKPLAGARVAVEHSDGASVGNHVTDGNGSVRVVVDRSGAHRIHLGSAPPKPGETATREAPISIPVGETPAQPTAKAKPTTHEVPITIEVIDPKPNATFELTPGKTPRPDATMPKVPLHARVLVQGAPVAMGSLSWELGLSGNYRVRDAGGGGYIEQPYRMGAGQTSTKPDEAATFTLAPVAPIGGELEVRATFSGGAELAGITAYRTVTGCRVVGQNPARADVEALIASLDSELAWVLLRVFCWESIHRLAQFASGSGGGNKPGDPLYGAPSGVGIVQRDPTATEWRYPKNKITSISNFFPRIFWDWKENVAEGVASFKSDYLARGRAELESLRRRHPTLPPFTEALVVRAAIRHYNAGTEYAASPDGKHYVVKPAYTTNPGYVTNVLGDPHIDATRYPIPADVEALVWPIASKG